MTRRRGPSRGRGRPAPLFLLAFGALAAASWLGAAAAVVYVDDATCPATGSGTPASPYCRIQSAICAAAAGDTVEVAPGIYHEAVRMKPDVSLIAPSGPITTTIDAAGQPCTESDFCTKRSGAQCSVVTFPTGHTPSTRIEGFTITGGAGLIQTSHVAGGGLFVFSSPTIAGNVITGNELSGPRSQYKGAGVYVAVGAPVITGNTITGNRAVPGPGAQYNLTYGYGGGIWVNFNTSPVITNNLIQGNQAGDPAADYSLGAGGGIVAFPGDVNHPGPVIDRNVIADNVTDTLGGGISLNSIDTTAALAVVTNNVIVGNSAKNGGGVYTYFNRSATINNTIADNFAFLGGGIYSGQSDPALTLPVVISNNIITGNQIDPFGDGGGIYTLDLSPTFDPLISFNDLWGNERNQIAGEQSDGSILGANGNFSSDPVFRNQTGRDFHLDAGSPAIDAADASRAPTQDHDGVSRGADGNGIPNNPAPGDVDVGAFESNPTCLLDTDLDSLADCVDPDDDNDGVADLQDCASLDAGSFGLPYEVANLLVIGGAPAVVTFDAQNLGSATRYEVVVGLLSRLHASGFQEGFCGASTLVTPSWVDTRSAPPPGDGWYYAARSVNGCGAGALGSPAADAAGAGDVCASGVVDQDGDGSPSDLDCNDANAAVSPLGVEICDGLDNDCSGAADDGFPDTDGDLVDDCRDADDDNDGFADPGDCAPLDAGSWGAPAEVQGLDVTGGAAASLTWQVQPIGAATRYEIAAGSILAPGGVDFAAGECLTAALAAPPATDGRAGPPADTAWYYLVKARNGCGPGTYGTRARNALPACP